jgi:hypothetical protein
LEDDLEDTLGVIQGATIAGRVATGKRAGQRALGSNMNNAIEVASQYPQTMHNQIFEELGW